MKLKTIYTFFFIVVASLMLALDKAPNITPYLALNTQDSERNATDEAFHKMMDVLTHQRCMNCHPTDNVPKQGDNRHPHYFGISRGANDKGFEATNCNTCHQSENNRYSGVPGAPHWSLAPASMGWQGLSRMEIAERLLDTKTNGNKSHAELVKHMTQDELVLWAWNPGIDANGKQREVPPVSKEDFKKAVAYWFDNGAILPSQ